MPALLFLAACGSKDDEPQPVKTDEEAVVLKISGMS
jgi:hypothetical protein